MSIYNGKNRDQRIPLTERSETRRSLICDSIFNGLFMLTIKDNSNNATEAELLFMVRYCAKFCKSSLIRHEIEFGKQGKIHIHAVCQSKNGTLPNVSALNKYLHKYIIWMEEERETPKGHIIERTKIDINSMTFYLSPVKDENHLVHLNTNYLEKEKSNYDGVDFLD